MNNILKLDTLKIYPIEDYSGFSKNLQYSDKIILPIGVCYNLVRSGIHFPPIFSMHLKENCSLSTFCTALEYSSELNKIYEI